MSSDSKFEIAISPRGDLFLDDPSDTAPQILKDAFLRGTGAALLFLEESQENVLHNPTTLYWRDFARAYLSSLVSAQNFENISINDDEIANVLQIDLPAEHIERFLLSAPPMAGGEYLSEETLRQLWQQLAISLREDIRTTSLNIEEYFLKRRPWLNLLGKVCFHLAETKNSSEYPFAFLATYAHRLSNEGKTQHLPLNRALAEYGSSQQKDMLLRLLSPIQKAAQESPFLDRLVRSGEIFQTLAWTPKDAHNFLHDAVIFEKSGIAIRVPNWWKSKQPSRPQVLIRLGDKENSELGLQALIDFSLSVQLGNEELNQQDLKKLLSMNDNLVFFKGQWIDINREKLKDLLNHWKTATQSFNEGLSFGHALRMLSGVDSLVSENLESNESEESNARIIAGEWLKGRLTDIQNPHHSQKNEAVLRKHLNAELRPYQKLGLAWLDRLYQLRLGSILADDMGLGKTIQIISLLLLRKHTVQRTSPSILVVPASLLGNWNFEISRFAPSLRVWIAHSSGRGLQKPELDQIDIVLTTYGTINQRLSWILGHPWNCVIADEAQNIKNPSSKQTQNIKQLKSQHRIALTGTPVENHLTDLWSLFDFVSPGLLGTSSEFHAFVKKQTKARVARNSESTANPYASIRKLIRPYILRRMKTDKNVIRDLPDKTEIKTYCQLSKAQAALYIQTVDKLAEQITTTDGIKRKGLVFSSLMKLKQICNHPAQLLKQVDFSETNSGKYQRLREICEIIHEKQEKVLIFTQFKELTVPLHSFLVEIFKKEGLILHGEVSIKKRTEMVKAFQSDHGPPFFILSLKAGGSGLNLTAASHVIHFDRWWNPAVENQATDRAFRIGQKKNVLVHKFVCKGTLEEKIDDLIESKKVLSNEILDENESPLLTEMSNDELLSLVRLDLKVSTLESQSFT